MIQTSVASLRWLSPSARNDYRHHFGIVIGFVGIGTNGVTLRVSMMEGYKPPSYSVVGWKVADIVATVRALAAAGVETLRYPFLEQDELGIWTAPGGAAKVAFFSDPDGNVLSLTES
jgi:hypothetical protein